MVIQRLALCPLTQSISTYPQGVSCLEFMQIKKKKDFDNNSSASFNRKANVRRVPAAHPNATVFNVYIPYWDENFNSA